MPKRPHRLIPHWDHPADTFAEIILIETSSALDELDERKFRLTNQDIMLSDGTSLERLSDLGLIYCAGGRAPHFPDPFRQIATAILLKRSKKWPRSPTLLATIAQVRQPLIKQNVTYWSYWQSIWLFAARQRAACGAGTPRALILLQRQAALSVNGRGDRTSGRGPSTRD